MMMLVVVVVAAHWLWSLLASWLVKHQCHVLQWQRHLAHWMLLLARLVHRRLRCQRHLTQVLPHWMLLLARRVHRRLRRQLQRQPQLQRRLQLSPMNRSHPGCRMHWTLWQPKLLPPRHVVCTMTMLLVRESPLGLPLVLLQLLMRMRMRMVLQHPATNPQC